MSLSLSLAQPLGQVIMGCGSDVKASFCLGQGKLAFPSPYLGNLENPETLDGTAPRLPVTKSSCTSSQR